MKVQIIVHEGASLYIETQDILEAARSYTVRKRFTVRAQKWVDDRGQNPTIYEFEYLGNQFTVSEEFVEEIEESWFGRLLHLLGVKE